MDEKDFNTIPYDELEDWHCTPLAAATFTNSIDVIKILLKNHASLESTHYGTGYSLLEICYFENNYETFHLLIENGINPFLENEIIQDALNNKDSKFYEYYSENFNKIIFTEELFESYIEDNFEEEITYNEIYKLMTSNSSIEKLLLSDGYVSDLIGIALTDIEDFKSLLTKYPDLKNRNYTEEDISSICHSICFTNEESFNYIFNTIV